MIFPLAQIVRLFRGRILSQSVAFSIVLLLLSLTLLLAPRSEAGRQASSPGTAGLTNAKRRRPEFVPGEALVRFKPNKAFEGATYLAVPNEETFPSSPQSDTQPAAPAPDRVAVSLGRFEGSDLVDGLRIARMAPADTMIALAALRSRDDVIYAEPNYVLHGDDVPNDPSFGSLYGMLKIGAPQAWDTTHGSRNVVVGVIDEGIDISHPDLAANIWTNPSQGAVGLAADLHGYDFHDNSGTIPPELHATHVAGTIGAEGNNNVGVAGVNWQVSLMSLRFISAQTNSGTEADAIRAYNYAKQMRNLWVSSGQTQGANIRVLNASYGGGGYSQASADALTALGQAGILFVAAAGNESANTDIHPHYPSNYSLPNVISVAATDSGDALASFSNYGVQSVLLGAPGVGIFSTTPSNGYGSLSGTSMATPHVSGAAALLCAANPNVTVNQLRALLSFNGDPVLALQGKTLSGRRLNVSNSLAAMNSGDTTPPGTVTGLAIASQTGRTVNLSWTSSGDDGPNGQASLYDISFTDQTTSAVIPLTTVAPSAPGTLQNVSFNLPYLHFAGTIKVREFDNVGNEGTPATVAVNVDPNAADPYVTALNPPVTLSTGGVAQGLTFDDRYKENVPLGFNFPFFGQTYTTVAISTNGNLYFSAPPKRPNGDADDVPGSTTDLSASRMIAGMWDDLDLRTSRRADADVYVISDSNHIIFRWQGVQFGDGTSGAPINFEIELQPNGKIITRYGSGNTNLFPVVGISGGEPDPYVVAALTSQTSPKSLTNAQSASFIPKGAPTPTPDVIQFSAPLFNVAESARADILVTRTANSTGPASVSYATSDSAGGLACNVINGSASSRCDYISAFGTLSFAAGETSKTISILLIDDSYAEGNESFIVTLSNPSGAALGAQSTTTVVINDNENANGANPFTLTNFFVRQQYLDFLNREPDAPGLAFWSNNIDGCAPQPSCTGVKRADTSAAFFLSIEFQDTGYLVERMYQAAYGSGTGSSTLGGMHSFSVPIVRFNEFLADTQEIGRGVIVGAAGWETALQANKQNFAADFAARSRFTTAFPPNNTSPAAFVDALFANAGVTPTATQRMQAQSEFQGAANISDLTARAKALRDVAENPTLASQEFNRAFVLMQYFGYLRRNPNDTPDADHTGFDFWLGKLNQFNGNYVAAEMVKSFIEAAEYRRRFGP